MNHKTTVFFTKDDVINIISLTYNLCRKGEFVKDEWFYEYPYYDDVLEKIREYILNVEDNRKTFTNAEIEDMASKEILYNDIKRACWIEGAEFINNKLKK